MLIFFRTRPMSIMVLFSVALHLVWAMLIIADTSAMDATAIASVHRWIDYPWIILALISVASLAIIGLAAGSPWFVLLLIPQQILLTMSAVGAIEAIWISQFADGVIRSRAFITADQVYSILTAIGHTAAIVMHAGSYYVRKGK